MLKGFREFILRGNVIDLAVAVVIGAAFTAVVNSIVTNVINPAIGAIFNAEDLSKTLDVTVPTTSGGEAHIVFGAVLAALLNFLIVAAVVYFALVLPVNYLLKKVFAARNEPKTEEQPSAPSELELLGQIRDLLAADQAAHHGKHADDAEPAAAPDGATPATPAST
ncbi:large conductance mechanosensitive channel protein MscL [Galbitalea sp. SE-J8]|uniref:large conductance mechanosensitive channel protein MscL n=1 Tax=Galbitalea sp. SE-J8 TaxID=3054952 RepID=UPI00259C6AB6|nr:large conductance mechanosensitive channel protein MscL [Galbitalea sp. SE-J8]MDM4762008.1 large conductance mechanosensitive channel protein MscL [Galbitalea sp. SE-J8]